MLVELTGTGKMLSRQKHHQYKVGDIHNLSRKAQNKIMVDSNQVLLPFPEYTFWLDAVLHNDKEEVAKCLQEGSENEKLLNGNFQIPTFARIGGRLIMSGNYGSFNLQNAWCLTGAFRSHDVMSLFIQHGVDILQQDIKGNNIIHCIVFMAFLDDAEQDYLVTLEFLFQLLQGDPKSKCVMDLLMTENMDSLRPLEVAANLGCFKLFWYIFEHPGVYLKREEPQGMYTVQWFDVSEYELYGQNTRIYQSPITALGYVDFDLLDKDSTKAIFQSDLIKSWFVAKNAANTPFTILWLSIRIMYMLAFIMMDTSIGSMISVKHMETSYQNASLSRISQNISMHQNMTNTCGNMNNMTKNNETMLAIMVYLAIHSFLIITFDIIEASLTLHFRQHTIMLYTPRHRKTLVVYYGFYRVMQVILSVCVLTMASAYFTAHFVKYISIPDVIFHLLYIQSSTSMIWSILYFIQLIPWLGHFVISVQRMITDLLQFGVLLALFITPYAFTFQMLLNDINPGKCISEFDNILHSYYTIFTAMLNMVNFTSFNTSNQLSLYILHITFVFMIPVLLMNLLIAVFSNSYAEITDHKDIVMTIQKMSMITVMERRLHKVCGGVYNWLKRKTFVCEDDRLYITRLVKRKKGNAWTAFPKSSF